MRVEEMFALIERDLEAAAGAGLDADLHYIFAYSAARTTAELVMLSEGFRPGRTIGNHAAIFVFLGASNNGRWNREAVTFDLARQARNVLQYERPGVVSAADSETLRQHAAAFAREVTDWLRRHHPDFLPPSPSEPS